MTEQITFDELCDGAVQSFLQSVVVIDNQASLEMDKRAHTAPRQAARQGARASSPGGNQKTAEDKNATVQLSDKTAGAEEVDALLDDPHCLDLNTVSRAFAEAGLTCGVYLPKEDDPADSATLVTEAVKAILPTDACVLDWQLRMGSARESVEIVKSVLKQDDAEGGRLRLIVVYTAEDLTRAETALRAALKDHFGLDETDRESSRPYIAGKHFRIVFLNKPTTQNAKDNSARADWKSLPQLTLSEFGLLSRGLLRSYALHSVSAVRRDMHRILAKFDPDLDPAFAADRATKSDPDDAGRLVEEIFLSETTQILALAGKAQDCLGPLGLRAWLREGEGNNFFREKAKNFSVAGRDISELNADSREYLTTTRPPSVFKKSSIQKDIQSSFFETDTKQELASRKFAALSLLARCSDGTVLATHPRLRLGSIIRDDAQNVFLCLQPACDSVRVTQPRPFLLVELIPTTTKFQLVLPLAEGTQLLKLPRKEERHIKSVVFPPSPPADAVLATTNMDATECHFTDSDGTRWRWLGDLREVHAMQLGSEILTPLGRVGVNSLEWLRLQEK